MHTRVIHLFRLGQESYPRKEASISNGQIYKFQLAESLVMSIIVIHVLSMGSSSLVEEEHYLWHFMTSTFLLVLLHKTAKGNGSRTRIQLCFIAVIVVSGRILRGWHQGGVNWTHLPDISKSLEMAGSGYIKSFQLLSVVLVIVLCLYALSSLRSKNYIIIVTEVSYICAGLLVLQYVIKYQSSGDAALDNNAILAARLIYVFLATCTTGTVIASPWFMLFQNSGTYLDDSTRNKDLFLVIKESLYLTGTTYIFSWCLLQLLLQQPVNLMPISLLLMQILATIYYASHGADLKQWVEIAGLYYLGMAGHFSLGNTNTLATIDVAGAFIGISSHSTVLSGLLMFVITYASPMLALLSLVMSISVKDINAHLKTQDANMGQLLKMILGFPCLVPLGLNSVVLVAYTIVLLLMRNHLFIWTVFSPKYIYVVVMTSCVLVGVLVVYSTVTYIVSAVLLGTQRLSSIS